MELYIIRQTDTQAHEGSPDVVAVFLDKDKADEACELLRNDEEEYQKKTWGDRWRSFASYYEVEPWTTDTDPLAVLAEVTKDRR